MSPLTLACLAWPVEPLGSVSAFAAKLDGFCAEARAGGADLLLAPEYACVELGAALAGNRSADEASELHAMVAASGEVLEAMRAAARRHRLWLQPGTLPMADGGRVVNRAPLIAPDGRLAMQEKRQMTRFESERWGVSPGAPPSVFPTPWGLIGIAICYDAEFPKLVRAQVEAGAWLVLVPTCTDTAHGFQRVRIAARARAMENQCFVAVAPTVGGFAASAALDQNHGAAGIFGPVDRGFREDGVIAEGGYDAPGLVLARLDPARIEAVRADGAVRNHRDWPRASIPRPEPAAFA
ncbi:nitrilase-related carbon-nitrogen hydrolase [Rubritepida flocculans]|uniref:nitrilase-related carbon-nitrogen hydrolase n=1 Tax=Rubritepida flocculans TaxID=182403 RepID=UPI00040B4C3A|nr:nitrilase-related carbon-nitrogen hydrolase [Rubritepida flocculans]